MTGTSGPTRASGASSRPAAAVTAGPIAAWTLRELVRVSLGYPEKLQGFEFENGVVRYGSLCADLGSPGGLEQLRLMLERASSGQSAIPQEASLRALLTQVELARLDNQLNQRTQIVGSNGREKALPPPPIDDVFLDGSGFELSLARVRGTVTYASEAFPELEQVRRYFDLGDGQVLLPVHPQERSKVAEHAYVQGPDAHLGASERTLRTVIDDQALQLKTDFSLAELTWSERPMDQARIDYATSLTDVLARWLRVNEHRRPYLALEPELAGIVGEGTEREFGAIIRGAAYPPRSDGLETQMVRAYSFNAPDPADPLHRPLAVKLVEEREDPSEDPIHLALRMLVLPLIEAGLTVHVDWNAVATLHRQNISYEMGDERLTGRVGLCDMTDLVVRPAILNGLSEEDREVVRDSLALQRKSLPRSITFFSDWLIGDNLASLMGTLASAWPERSADLQAGVETILVEGLDRRRNVIRKFHSDKQSFLALLEEGPQGDTWKKLITERAFRRMEVPADQAPHERAIEPAPTRASRTQAGLCRGVA